MPHRDPMTYEYRVTCSAGHEYGPRSETFAEAEAVREQQLPRRRCEHLPYVIEVRELGPWNVVATTLL